MKFEEIDTKIKHLRCISSERGKEIYNFILKNKPKLILELGFYHGKSTLYMAAALDELRRGKIITIDKEHAKNLDPNIEKLIEKTKLKKYIQPVYVKRSYNWELMKMIESGKIKFDFCFIDGGHTWDNTGYAFFLVEKLLKKNSWVLFDDLDWNIDSSPTVKNKEKIPEEERKTYQVKKVFDLLVKQHPKFKKFKEDGHWGWTKKIKN